MKKFYILALAAAMFAACATDVTEDVAIEAPETLKVSFEESTRIQLDDNKTVWTKGDLVSVFYRSDANQQWKFQGNTGDREGILKRVSAPEATEKLSKIVAVYPYSDNYYINPETCNIEATLPAEQTYLKDSYGLDGNLLVSATEFNQLYLRNVCGWLKIQLKGEGQVVKKITLKGNNGEQVAGLIYVDSSDATATLAAEHSAGGDDGVGGTLVFEDTILTEVALNCPNGVTLSSTAKAFYIALPPQTFAKGLSVEVSCSDESVMTKSTDSSITIERNSIQPMAALTYDGIVPEVYELVYTTNDGQPLDPYTTEGFGANFVENTYDATTGKGSLKFDAQMTYIPDRAFVGCSNLTSINLTKQIKKIGIEAFNGCSALAVIEIPGSVYSIGDKAFYHCSGMQEITIPKGVSIGVSSFEGCSGKANINCSIPNGHYATGKFYKANFNEVVLGEGITYIGCFGFYNCSNIKKITIPNSLTFIDDNVFAGCGNIEQVNISSLESWCKISFEDGSAHPARQNTKIFLAGEELIDVVIPESVTNIAPYAFYKIKSIKSVTMHDKVTYIGTYAFYGCSALTNACIGDRVTSIGNNAFNDCTSLTSVTIGDRVTSIGGGAFSGCTSLKEVYYNGDLSAWCKIDFSGSNPMCNGAKLYLNGVELTEATIPSNVTEIKGSAFFGCTSLTSVTIPDSVTEIGEYTFRDCTSLTSVTIGDSVTSIGERAFYDCTSLKEVYCKPTTPPSGGDDMFSYYSNGFRPIGCKIYVPRASVDAYKAASYWSSYESYIEPHDF